MTGFIDIELIGDDVGVARMLRHLDTALDSTAMAAFLGIKVGVYLKERAKHRFEAEGDDVSGKWAPLLPSTQYVREHGPWEVGPSSPINVRTRELETYITQSDIFASSFGYGASVAYPGRPARTKALRQKVETAQRGRARPATVARPVLGINERDALYILTQMAFYISGKKMP